MAEGTGVDTETRQEFQLPPGQSVVYIWREIFGYLNDATDFHNLLLASPEYFEPLLEDRTSALLFPLALKVLDRREYISKSTTLECRLVSKFTKSSIDNWIREGNPCFENLSGSGHDIWDPKHDIAHCWIPAINQPWQNHVENVNPKCNPFLNGYIAWNVSMDINDLQLRLDFRVLLTHFGNQIRYFRFAPVGRFDLCLEFLAECLEQMPNLRTLEISNYTHTDDEQGNTSQPFLPSMLPNLRDLSTMYINGNPSMRLVSVVLEKYGTQLKNMCLRYLLKVDLNQLPLGMVGNWRHLSLPWINGDVQASEYFNPTRELLPILETISVKANISSGEHILTNILVALENYFGMSSKLQNLNILIRGQFHGNIQMASLFRFVLPSLKRLWIHCEMCVLLSIDFILGMRTILEELTLDMRFERPSDMPDESQFARLVDRMHDSNLWAEMVKLERITIRWGKISRSVPKVKVYSYSGPQKPRISERKD